MNTHGLSPGRNLYKSRSDLYPETTKRELEEHTGLESLKEKMLSLMDKMEKIDEIIEDLKYTMNDTESI